MPQQAPSAQHPAAIICVTCPGAAANAVVDETAKPIAAIFISLSICRFLARIGWRSMPLARRQGQAPISAAHSRQRGRAGTRCWICAYTPPATRANQRSKPKGGGPGTVRSRPEACGGLADDLGKASFRQGLMVLPAWSCGGICAARKDIQSNRTLTVCLHGSAIRWAPELSRKARPSPNPPPPDDPGKAHALSPYRADLVRRRGVINLFGCNCQR